MLLHSFRGAIARNDEAEGVVQSAAASISVRGALFGNSHPLPPRFPFVYIKHAIYVFLFSFCVILNVYMSYLPILEVQVACHS